MHKGHGFKQPSLSTTRPTNPFYGHRQTAYICSRFITHLFHVSEYPPPSYCDDRQISNFTLPYFIAYSLYRTRFHPSIAFAALFLLQRLKARFPQAKGSSGHHLFMPTFMIASKMISDDAYRNSSWRGIAKDMFTLNEVNQMEREMCLCLGWELTIDGDALEKFEQMVRQDFNLPQDPSYPVRVISKPAAICRDREDAAILSSVHPPLNTTGIPSSMAFMPRNLTPSPLTASQPAVPPVTTTRSPASFPQSIHSETHLLHCARSKQSWAMRPLRQKTYGYSVMTVCSAF